MKWFALAMVAQAVCASAVEPVVENAPLKPGELKNERGGDRQYSNGTVFDFQLM